MDIVKAGTYEEMSELAAELVEAELRERPQAVLGLATGSTPEGMYAALARDCESGKVSFAEASSYNLDEYCGIPASSPDSYHAFMEEHLFSKVNFQPGATHLPDGNGGEAACESYEKSIEQAGWVDLQVLGIGNNGHIGFNEPSDHFPVATHLVKLKQETIDANSRLFEDASLVPREAITMGIGTIMKARRILILANGDAKAEIVKRAFFGEVTPEVPASVLQLHRDVTVMLDARAAALIP